MKKLLLLSVLLIFACSWDDSSDNDDNSFTCNAVNSNLLVGSESSDLCNGVVYDELGNQNSLTLYSNSGDCFADNVPNNDAFIAFYWINSSVDGLEPGSYSLSGHPPAVGQLSFYKKTYF